MRQKVFLNETSLWGHVTDRETSALLFINTLGNKEEGLECLSRLCMCVYIYDIQTYIGGGQCHRSRTSAYFYSYTPSGAKKKVWAALVCSPRSVFGSSSHASTLTPGSCSYIHTHAHTRTDRQTHIHTHMYTHVHSCLASSIPLFVGRVGGRERRAGDGERGGEMKEC